MNVPVIKEKKVILRPLSLRDAPRYCTWLADTEVTMFLNRFENPPSLKEERQWITKTRRNPNEAVFAIETIEGRHIGSAGLHKIDKEHKNAEFGIIIGDKEYWGQGLGTEVVGLVLKFGFGRLKLHRIYLECFAFNTRGMKAYKKNGFKNEGTARQHTYRKGQYHDMMRMGILKHEYRGK